MAAGVRGHRGPTGRGDPAEGVAALEALDHLLGGAEDTVPLFIGQLQRGFEAFVLQLVVMLAKDLNGFLADLFGDPDVDLSDGQLSESGSEEVRGQDVFRG